MLRYAFALATDYQDADEAARCLRALPSPLRERVEATRDELLRRQRLAAYNLLRTVWRLAHGGHMPVMRMCDGEAPTFPATPQYTCSISHSGEWVFVAITDEGLVGVDVQEVAPFCDAALSDRISGRFCTERERHLIDTMLPAERPRALAELWVQKEAAAKMDGRGISALGSFDTTLPPAQQPCSVLVLSPVVEGDATGSEAVAALCFSAR